MSSVGLDITRAQHESLDSTDALASVWSLAVQEAVESGKTVSWGGRGRGRGGRDLSRKTFQPLDITVEDVCLEYMNDTSLSGLGKGGSKVLLDNAYLKLLPGRVYTLVGRNGVGKSTLMKRIAACKIPGFPPHISSLLVQQEVFGHDELTPIDILLRNQETIMKQSKESNKFSISQLEEEMDALDLDADDYQESMEAICNKIAELEESEDAENDGLTERAHEALQFFGVPESMFHKPTSQLSGGIRKKVSLASALMSRPQLLLLDEPTCHIDIGGILQLRKLIADCAQSNATIVLTSHDVDLMNDVATDTIHFDEKQHVLSYYSGNYRCFLKYRNESLAHQMKQAGALEKQRSAMVSTIDNLKKKSARSDSRQAKKKINKTIKSKTKKLERHGVEKNELGHRRTAQSDGGIRKGAINGLPAEQRNMSHKKLLKAAEINIGPVPDKAVQFDFEPVNCTWGDEPLVSVMDVGHSFDEGGDKGADFIFDCVDLSVREGTRTVILGENGSGKTSLLRIISGELSPTVGSVHFASGVTVAHFHQHSVDELMYDYEDGRNDVVTALTLLSERYPAKTEQDVRGMLTRFGLSPKQADTNVRFLSGGERCRLCMADLMLQSPHLLVIDELSNHLDVESVDALIYGLGRYNGTVVMASHDAHLIRSVGGDAFVLFGGSLQRVEGGIDEYLKVFNQKYNR